MLVVKTLVVGDLETNCYLVSDSATNETIIIDPGDDADYITEAITNEKLKPATIVLTHGHFDHVLGCLELKLNFGVPILLHQNDLKLYNSANRSAHHWLKKKSLKVPPIDHFLKENDEIDFGSEKLTIIETPGHTPGSVCLYDGAKYLFSGDTLFKDGVGRTDFSYSRPLQLTKSLDKLFKLPGNIVVYPGHGDLFSLQDFLGQSEDAESLQ